MKKKAINFLGRIIYSSKIKYFESRLEEIYEADFKNKSWEEYAIDCFKIKSENEELIISSSGTQRIDYVCGLQALYNIRSEELNFIEDKVGSMKIHEYKTLFSSEYETILSDIRNLDLNEAVRIYSEFGEISNPSRIKNKMKWKHVNASLIISAIDETFGEQLNEIENNLRNL